METAWQFPFVSGRRRFVDLTDRATGTYVTADAIKFVAPTDSAASTTPPASVLREVVVDNSATRQPGPGTRPIAAELPWLELLDPCERRHRKQLDPMDADAF